MKESVAQNKGKQMNVRIRNLAQSVLLVLALAAPRVLLADAGPLASYPVSPPESGFTSEQNDRKEQGREFHCVCAW